jgi:hypothetical protein
MSDTEYWAAVLLLVGVLCFFSGYFFALGLIARKVRRLREQRFIDITNFPSGRDHGG